LAPVVVVMVVVVFALVALLRVLPLLEKWIYHSHCIILAFSLAHTDDHAIAILTAGTTPSSLLLRAIGVSKCRLLACLSILRAAHVIVLVLMVMKKLAFEQSDDQCTVRVIDVT
jgi:hypothetical protein